MARRLVQFGSASVLYSALNPWWSSGLAAMRCSRVVKGPGGGGQDPPGRTSWSRPTVLEGRARLWRAALRERSLRPAPACWTR